MELERWLIQKSLRHATMAKDVTPK